MKSISLFFLKTWIFVQFYRYLAHGVQSRAELVEVVTVQNVQKIRALLLKPLHYTTQGVRKCIVDIWKIAGKKVYEAIKESAFHSFESYVARKQILEGGDIGKVVEIILLLYQEYYTKNEEYFFLQPNIYTEK